MMKNMANALIVICFLSAPVFGAQRSPGRVLTNEDIGTTAPASDVPSATSGVEAAAKPDAKPADLPSTPMADLNRVKAIQAIFMDLYNEIAVKAGEASDAALQKRWTDINLSLSTIIQANQLTIEELQDRLGIKPPAEGGEASPSESQSAPATEPAPATPPAQ
jgi:hypothetical protein